MTPHPAPPFPRRGPPRAAGLTGKLLIAMPGMTDPRFVRSVILVCAHTDEGAMGLVLNRPLPDVGFADLLGQLGIDMGPRGRRIEVRFGGPVEPGRGFVLHRLQEGADAAAGAEGRLHIARDLAMTTTRDILAQIARGGGPRDAVLALGYTGWGPGQLEGEMAENGWLSADPAAGEGDALIFGAAHDGKWAAALRGMGVDPSMLSAAAGRA